MSATRQAATSAHVVGTARDRLLRAADELFYLDGILATSVDAVVARAGVAVASLYNLFRNKDGLVVAYLEDRDRRWREVWEAEIGRHRDPVNRLLAVFDALPAWARVEEMTRGCAHTAAAAQLGADGHPALTVIAVHKEHIRKRLTDLAREAGQLRPEMAAADLVIVYEGVLSCSLLGGSEALLQGHRLAMAVLPDSVHRDPTP